jgi:hypothetical protein
LKDKKWNQKYQKKQWNPELEKNITKTIGKKTKFMILLPKEK